MKRVFLAACGALLLANAACLVVDDRGDGGGPPPPPPDTPLELVNLTDFVLDANFFASASAVHESTLFVRENIYTEYSTSAVRTVAPHATAAFSLPCDATASIGVRMPAFSNPFTLTGGVSQDQIFLLRGTHFQCGERLRFVYFAENDQFRVRLERPQ